MIHQQDTGWFYAYCHCGVCGPLRRWRKAAKRDEHAHASVCTMRKAAA